MLLLPTVLAYVATSPLTAQTPPPLSPLPRHNMSGPRCRTPQVMDEENYDGPDITYYFDQKDKPPHGPDDDEGGDGGGPAAPEQAPSSEDGEELSEAKRELHFKFWSTQGGFF